MTTFTVGQCLNDTSKSAQELVADYSAARWAAGKKAFMDGPHFELAADHISSLTE